MFNYKKPYCTTFKNQFNLNCLFFSKYPGNTIKYKNKYLQKKINLQILKFKHLKKTKRSRLLTLRRLRWKRRLIKLLNSRWDSPNWYLKRKFKRKLHRRYGRVRQWRKARRYVSFIMNRKVLFNPSYGFSYKKFFWNKVRFPKKRYRKIKLKFRNPKLSIRLEKKNLSSFADTTLNDYSEGANSFYKWYFRKRIRCTKSVKNLYFIFNDIKHRYLNFYTVLFTHKYKLTLDILHLIIKQKKRRKVYFNILEFIAFGSFKTINKFFNRFFRWTFYKKHNWLIRNLTFCAKHEKHLLCTGFEKTGWSLNFYGKVKSYSGRRKRKFRIQLGSYSNRNINSKSQLSKKHFSSVYGALSVYYRVQ